MTKIRCLSGMLAVAIAVTIGLGVRALAANPQPTFVVTFDPAAGQLPESMTSDDNGVLYASNVNGQIQRIDPVGKSFSTVATVPLAAGSVMTGIKVGPDGFIYVTSGNLTGGAAVLWKVSLDTGNAQPFATFDSNTFPNDLVFQEDGTILVTEPFLGLLYKVDTAGNVSVWLADPLLAGDPNSPAFVGVHEFGVDGIAWDRNRRNLFVSNVDFGRVMRIPTDGSCAPKIQVIVEDPALRGVDGIAVDRAGTIWAAVNTQNRIATVSQDGTISVITEGSPLDSPSSFAFGTGRHDKQTLYIANFAIVAALTGGTPHPGILSIPVLVPGLPPR